jgi:hypothetical protein
MDEAEADRPGQADGLPPLVKAMLALIAPFVVLIDLVGFAGHV